MTTRSTRAAEHYSAWVATATPRRELQDAIAASGFGWDPIVRAWFDLARRAEDGRWVDESGWPLLSTRDLFILIREWGKTLRDLGEPVADHVRYWESCARDALFIDRREPLPGATEDVAESRELWADGARCALSLAKSAEWCPSAHAAIKAGALAGIDRLVSLLHRWRWS